MKYKLHKAFQCNPKHEVFGIDFQRLNVLTGLKNYIYLCVSGNAMVTHPANKKLNKTEFNNQEDWDTYPTADYCCDKCNETVSFNFTNLTKHHLSTFSNFNDKDKEAFDLFASANKLEPTNSFLDFYCPTCKRPVRIYYDSWAGGRHGEHGFSMKYIVD